MDYIHENRLVSKTFKCNKCKETCVKLVNPFKFIINCQKCGSNLIDIKVKNKILKGRNKSYKRPYIQMKNIDKKYTIETHKINKNKLSLNNNDERNNKFNDKNKANCKNNHNYHSINHYSNLNMNNVDNNQINNNNINDNYINNDHINNDYINNNQINNNNINNNYINNDRINNDYINNNQINNNINSINIISNNHLNNNINNDNINNDHYINNINYYLRTLEISASSKNHIIKNIISARSIFNNPYSIRVRRQKIADDIFDPNFQTIDNNSDIDFTFSLNLNNDLRVNFLCKILSILKKNQAFAAKKVLPLVSAKILKKKFNMPEKHYKKNENDINELPTCCICLSEIRKKNKITLPCGHILHLLCFSNWQKKNNICPLCRFEIK